MTALNSGGALLSCLVLAIALSGCPKSGDSDKPAPSGSVSASPAAPAKTAASDASAHDAAKAAGGTTTGAAASYGGTYSVAPASIYISDSKEFASVKQAKDEPSKHVGEGALTLAVDAEGKVTGTIDSGPAGPALIDGTLMGDEIRGNVRRKDPKDEGLTGTLAGKVSGDGIDGKLSLAEANAAIVRDGKLSLKKK